MIEKYKQFIGTEANTILGKLTIRVRILDIKESYGKLRYLITPVAGNGQVWREQVQFDTEEHQSS